MGGGIEQWVAVDFGVLSRSGFGCGCCWGLGLGISTLDGFSCKSDGAIDGPLLRMQCEVPQEAFFSHFHRFDGPRELICSGRVGDELLALTVHRR